MINAEPSWSWGNQPEKDYDVHDFRQIQEIVKPVDKGESLGDGCQLNSGDRDNHVDDEGHATQGRKQPDDEQAFIPVSERGLLLRAR